MLRVMKMKISWSLVLIMGVLPIASQAYTLDKLGDNNFATLVQGDVSQWICSVSDDTSGDITLCALDTDYTAADPGGITIGTTGHRTVLSQVTASLDNTNDLPIVRLSFDYRLTEPDNGAAATFNANVVTTDYQTHPLFTTTVDRTSDWRHVVIDLSQYAAGNPSVEFELDNGTTGTASVSIRHAHLYVRSYATLQATIKNQAGEPVNEGRLSIVSGTGTRAAVVRSQKLDRHGQIVLLQIPGRRKSYRIRFSYHGRHYYANQRFRYGDDFVFTGTFKRNRHSLVLQPA